TSLRLLGLPCLALSLWSAGARDLPDILVSEDARIVAVRTGGVLAANPADAGSFTLRVWQYAAAAPLAEKPAFGCVEGLCRLQLPDGAVIAHRSEERRVGKRGRSPRAAHRLLRADRSGARAEGGGPR